jgi:glucose/arabinose dehydrogenase
MTRVRLQSMRVFFGGAVVAVSTIIVALASCADEPTVPGPAADGALADGPAFDVDAGASADAPHDADASDGSDAQVALVDTCGSAGVVSGAWVGDPHLCLTVYAQALPAARQMAFAPNGDLFVLAGGFVVALFDANKDGVIGANETSTYSALSLGLTHGIAFSPDGAFLYVSSESAVLRWPYKSGDRLAPGDVEPVVRDMPTGGPHYSRTLVFDKQARLYVNVGSQGDVDIDPQLNALRAQVRRFTLPLVIPDGGVAYDSGEVYASGLRNEVGLAFDSKGRMWGVENGSDGLYQSVASQVLEDNPAEKINRLDAPGSRFYGYPYCWTEFGFDGGMGSGTQWAYGLPSPQTDSWCRDAKNVQPPAGTMSGHWAPLGVTEYAAGSLPWKGDLFVTAHGSSARAPAVGRLVARAHLVGDKVVSVTPIAGHLVDGGLEQGTWDARPVDIRVGPDGALYFSDDLGGRVFRIGYKP